MILKTDNEAALVDLRAGVAEKLSAGQVGADGLHVVLEAPPAHEPQSNGMIENGVKQVKGDDQDPDAGLGEPDPGGYPDTPPHYALAGGACGRVDHEASRGA